MTNKDYKMTKQLKIQLALMKFRTQAQKSSYRKLMIQAEESASKSSFANLNKSDSN